MIRTIRIAFATLAVAFAAFVSTGLPFKEGPTLWQFLILMIVPALAALALAPRTLRFTFIAGAFYASLAAIRRMTMPEGNITATEQLSTAALAALLVPIVARVFRLR